MTGGAEKYEYLETGIVYFSSVSILLVTFFFCVEKTMYEGGVQ